VKYGYLSVIVMASAAACAVPTSSSSEGNETLQSAATSCPTLTATQANERAAATIAYNLMKLASVYATGTQDPGAGWSILASQRYQVQSSGTGIEFNPNDNLYVGGWVTAAMKAALAIPQQASPDVATFLSQGLKTAQSNTNGSVYPSFQGIGALYNFNGTGPTTVSVPNFLGASSDKVTLTAAPTACGSTVFTFSETVVDAYLYAPILAESVDDGGNGGGWMTNLPTVNGVSVPAGFNKSGLSVPSTPFNGTSTTTGNSFLVLTINGVAPNWSTPSDFAGVDCYNYAHSTCTGSVQIDPAPYSEPGPQYNTAGVVLGTTSNPFTIDSNYLVADPTHEGQWATRVVSGVLEWGTFTTPVTIGAFTDYVWTYKHS
jgi:hypothetical protein